MLELIVGLLFWTTKHASKWLFTSNCHFNATFRPSRASSGIQRSLWWAKRCIEVTIGSEESFVGVLDRPNNHPAISLHTIEANKCYSRLSKLDPHKSTSYQLHSCLPCAPSSTHLLLQALVSFPTLWEMLLSNLYNNYKGDPRDELNMQL